MVLYIDLLDDFSVYIYIYIHTREVIKKRESAYNTIYEINGKIKNYEENLQLKQVSKYTHSVLLI